MTDTADHDADHHADHAAATGQVAPVALWAGDSFTDGDGARGWLHGREEGRERTYPALVSAALGWRDAWSMPSAARGSSIPDGSPHRTTLH